MADAGPEDPRQACRKEKDPRAKIRMAAVNMACINGQSLQLTADSLM